MRKRTPDQCRSHHQKLQNRFDNDIVKIIDFVRSKIGRQELESGDKDDKTFIDLKPTGTGTCEVEEYETLVIDLGELAVW